MIESLKAVKTKLNLTLEVIASATDVSETTVSRYLNGIQDIPEYWIERFCTAFDVSMEWLKTGKGEPEFITEPKPEKVRDKSETAARLKQMRQELGLSRKEVYQAIGIDQTMYSRLENGHANLMSGNARKLEDAFGYGADWLMYGDESRKKYPIGRKVLEWLWTNEEERKHIWDAMEKDLNMHREKNDKT